MVNTFGRHIERKDLFRKDQRLLVAVSGGVDSMVLVHLLHVCSYTFSMAHCNFQLRGSDSDKDEALCRQTAEQLGVPFHSRRFDTENYSRLNKLNIQLSARKLRYDWFDELLEQEKYDRLLTAHHVNDAMETVFINLLRGTGINGLKGIPEKKGKLVRPLLSFTREEIENFARLEKIGFRTDKSNADEKYDRNFIRLKVIPLLKNLNPGLEETFLRNLSHLSQEASIVNEYLQERAKYISTRKPGSKVIDRQQLLEEKYPETLLHYLLHPFGFNETQEANILRNLREKALPGKLFQSPGFVLSIDRQKLVIKSVSPAEKEAITINALSDLSLNHDLVMAEELNEFELPGKKDLIVSKEKLVFPLEFRSRKKGDKFMPFGMKHFKLVSDFFKDQKLDHFEKENCRLLVNGNGDIMWVAGYRSDERYKVKQTDKNLLKLTFLG